MHTEFYWEVLREDESRWEDNIKINLKEVGRDSGDWIHLAQDSVRAIN